MLDDGFQFYQLERDLDIVLLKADDPLEGGLPLPAGNLRELASHLRRADALITTGDENGTGASEDVRWTGLPMFTARRWPTSLVDLRGRRNDVDILDGMPVGCFCGLGNPEQFEQGLRSLGANLVCNWRLHDHQPVSINQLSEYISDVSEHGGKMLICTQKDIVKLPQGTNDYFIRYLEITMQFDISFWPWFDARVRSLVPRTQSKTE